MIVFYFSATGNSKYVAELFCENMNAGCHSIEEDTDFSQLIIQNDIVGFCYPIYGSRVPRLMRDFVEKNIKLLENKKLIIFCTQMGFSGDGARVLTDLFPRDYVNVVQAEHFLMPTNVCNLSVLPLAGKKLTQWYLVITQKRTRKVCDNIRSGIIKKRGFNPISRALGLIQGTFLPGIERRALSKVWIKKDCNQCGLCVSLCPMNNLMLTNGTIVPQNNCMMCYRCINKCPQKAISVFLRGKVKTQYTGV